MNGRTKLIFILMTALFLATTHVAPPHAAEDLSCTISTQALTEILPLAIEAVAIYERASARQQKHMLALHRRGLAEVPPSEGERHVVRMSSFGKFVFDNWGELSIDRRFVTDDEMKTVHAIEAWIAKWFPAETKARKTNPKRLSGSTGLPIFRGFEAPRYQQHDALIAQLVAEFNANKATGCGGTPAQAARIPDLSPALVKAHMIEETGGNGPRSKAAWPVDPLQVNVPGDWGEEKRLVGLSRPTRRNEGSAEKNVRAAIRYLSRKGFSTAARPAAERPNGYFDSWHAALKRYNGRRDRTQTDRYYSDEYADKIRLRASNPDLFVPLEIRLAKDMK